MCLYIDAQTATYKRKLIDKVRKLSLPTTRKFSLVVACQRLESLALQRPTTIRSESLALQRPVNDQKVQPCSGLPATTIRSESLALQRPGNDQKVQPCSGLPTIRKFSPVATCQRLLIINYYSYGAATSCILRAFSKNIHETLIYILSTRRGVYVIRRAQTADNQFGGSVHCSS